MKRLFLLFCLPFLVVAACTKQATVPPQEDILYQLEEYINKKPDSLLKILDTLNVDVLSEKERAHYCLLKAQVRSSSFKYDDETDSLLQVAENYFIGSNEKFFEAETCEALSMLAFKKGKGEQVKLEWRQKAYQSMQQCKTIDERHGKEGTLTTQEIIDGYKNKLLMSLGMCYLDNEYFQKGLECLKPVDDYFAEFQKTKQKHSGRFLSALMLGNAYLALKEYDSCRMCYENGLYAAEQLNDPEKIAHYHYSMSMFYRYRWKDHDYEDEEEGQQLLDQAIAECYQGLSLYEGKMFRYKDGFYDELSKLYYQCSQYDSCILYSEKRMEFLNQMHFEIVPNSVNAGIYERLYKSYEALGDKDKTLEYAALYYDMEKAIQDNPQAVERVKRDYEQELEAMQLQHEQQVRRYRLYLLFALLLGALVLVLWMANRYRKNKEIEMLRQEEAYRKLQSEFDAASQHSLKVLQQRAMELYRTGQKDRTERILAEFAAVYPQAMERLQTEHPELMEAERNIVVLSYLGFRVKEEAELLGLSANTVTKYRTNIRKKIGNDPISSFTK